MPGLASTTPQPQELAAHTVGSPVSATSFAQIAAAQANFALARALPVVASLSPHMLALTSATLNFPLQWWPSPGCRYARLSVALAGARYVNVVGRVFTDRSAIHAGVTVPSGAAVVLGEGTGGPLDGIAELAATDPLSAMRPIHECGISLGESGDVADAIHDVTVTLSVTAPEQHQGIAEITLAEVPLTTLYPERGEVGLAFSAFDPRNGITDLSTLGTGRIGNGTADILTVSIAELEAMRDRLEMFHNLPLALAEIANGRRSGCALLRASLAREGVVLTGEPETWAAQIATAQAAEEERITLALDTAEARARAAAN